MDDGWNKVREGTGTIKVRSTGTWSCREVWVGKTENEVLVRTHSVRMYTWLEEREQGGTGGGYMCSVSKRRGTEVSVMGRDQSWRSSGCTLVVHDE